MSHFPVLAQQETLETRFGRQAARAGIWAVAALLSASVLLNASALTASTAAWPGYLYSPEEIADWPEADRLELEVLWTADIGPAYSSLAAADGKVFATFSRGEQDLLAAFSAADGQELWSLVLGARYKGHDGSDDGPLSTPWVTADHVYAISADGIMVAASMDGKEQWRRHWLPEGVEAPYYGVASSPRSLGDRGLLQFSDGKAGTLHLFNLADGTELQRLGEGKVTYQSPALVTLAGVEQVLDTTNQEIRGWDLESGDLLWTFRHKEKGAHEAAQPIVVDERRLLLVLDQESVMLGFEPTEGDGASLQVTELWRDQAFKRTDARPVVEDGTLYGFSGRIFSAFSSEDGSLLWRTRELSGSNLSRIPGHLLQLTTKGELVILATSPEAYTEKGRVSVFEKADYGNPAVVGSVVFVRNHEKLAAVQVRAAADTAEESEEGAETKDAEMDDSASATSESTASETEAESAGKR